MAVAFLCIYLYSIGKCFPSALPYFLKIALVFGADTAVDPDSKNGLLDQRLGPSKAQI